MMSKDEYVYKASRKCLKKVIFMDETYEPGETQHFTERVDASNEKKDSFLFKREMKEVCGDDWKIMSATLIKVFPVNHADNPRRIMEKMEDDEFESL